jgi:hypothetical protein
MKTIEKFENGMSIVQLEERFEMTSAGLRVTDDCLCIDGCD